jgi:hypothetical protein
MEFIFLVIKNIDLDHGVEGRMILIWELRIKKKEDHKEIKILMIRMRRNWWLLWWTRNVDENECVDENEHIEWRNSEVEQGVKGKKKKKFDEKDVQAMKERMMKKKWTSLTSW